MPEPDDEPLFTTFDEIDGEEGFLTETPTLTGAPAAFVDRLRALEPTWRSLGVGLWDTYLGYDRGRVSVGIRRSDDHDRLALSGPRIDLTESAWSGGWTSEPSETAPLTDQVDPGGLAGGAISEAGAGVAAAVEWLETELRSPLLRYRRRDGDRTTAGSWQPIDSWEDLEPEERPTAAAEWFDQVDAADGPSPPLGAAPNDFWRRLRAMAPLWRALAIEPGDTEIRIADGWVRATVELVDRELDLVFAVVRADVGETDWKASWVHPFRYDRPGFWSADPLGEDGAPITEPAAGVDTVTEWLVTELRRPVTRRTWHRGERVTDRWWAVEGNGVETIVSDPPYVRIDPATPHETTTVRATPDDPTWRRARAELT